LKRGEPQKQHHEPLVAGPTKQPDAPERPDLRVSVASFPRGVAKGSIGVKLPNVDGPTSRAQEAERASDVCLSSAALEFACETGSGVSATMSKF